MFLDFLYILKWMTYNKMLCPFESWQDTDCVADENPARSQARGRYVAQAVSLTLSIFEISEVNQGLLLSFILFLLKGACLSASEFKSLMN